MNNERIDEIVKDVFNSLVDDEKSSLNQCPKDDLIGYHHSAGRFIRNHYKLWETSWTPEIVDGVDYSPNHPDAVSMQIIERVWELVKQEKQNEQLA